MLTKLEIELLVNEYPFLWPTHVYGDLLGKKVEDFDYSYCELSHLPEGWIRSFIPEFLVELKKLLIKYNLLDTYFVVTARDQAGYFYWLGNHTNQEIRDLISKYSKKVSNYCYVCGSPNVIYRSTWNRNLCYCCAHDDFNAMQKTVDYPLDFNEEYELLYFPSKIS